MIDFYESIIHFQNIFVQMDATNLRIDEVTRILDKLRHEEEDDSDNELEDKEGLEAELLELKKANSARQKKFDEYEKNKKWNVDNMCHVVEERTIVNSNAAKTDTFTASGYVAPTDDKSSTAPETKVKSDKKVSIEKAKMSKSNTAVVKKTTVGGQSKATPVNSGPEREHVAMMSYHDFTVKYADRCEEFMKIHSMTKCQDFLIQHGNIMLQENASNYLLLASLEDEMNGFRNKMRQTARQSQIISNIAELAKSMKTHPGNVIIPFFKRLEQKEFMDGFMDGVETFVGNIIKRAVVKKKEIDEERRKEGDTVDLADIPKEERIGPGGLDPVEVFESLPQSMQDAFESRDVEQLKEALLAMEPSEAENHMKRCVASGLWNEG